jgi:glucose-6-phosphate 1-dehydrogenase
MAAFILIDNPVDSDPKNIAKEKANAIKKLEVKDISIGQYEGYDDELKSHDRKTSKTETFVKLSIFSRAKRWKNTKIILVTGKHLARKYADIELSYKKEPCILYCDINTYPNRLILNIQPVQDIDFHINTKTPGTNFEIKHTKLIFSHEKEFSSNTPESYEVIIEECINNDKTLFISNEELSAAWRFTDKIRDIASKMDPIIYKKGSDESDIKE